MSVIGTAGLVALCKVRGVIEAAAPVLEALRANGLYLAPRICEERLALVGEHP